jgi:hypothetical protein
MALPPVLVGAVHASVTCVLPGEPATPVTAPGADRGITAVDAVEKELVPPILVAAILN